MLHCSNKKMTCDLWNMSTGAPHSQDRYSFKTATPPICHYIGIDWGSFRLLWYCFFFLRRFSHRSHQLNIFIWCLSAESLQTQSVHFAQSVIPNIQTQNKQARFQLRCLPHPTAAAVCVYPTVWEAFLMGVPGLLSCFTTFLGPCSRPWTTAAGCRVSQ